MSEDMLKKIDALSAKTVSRRGFLRGSALVAGVIVAGAALPKALRAQSQDQQQQQEPKKDPQKDPDEKSDESKPETKIDAEGREYRSCPQCGYNMYRQGRTWTCENCGYSYVE